MNGYQFSVLSFYIFQIIAINNILFMNLTKNLTKMLNIDDLYVTKGK